MNSNMKTLGAVLIDPFKSERTGGYAPTGRASCYTAPDPRDLYFVSRQHDGACTLIVWQTYQHQEYQVHHFGDKTQQSRNPSISIQIHNGYAPKVLPLSERFVAVVGRRSSFTLIPVSLSRTRLHARWSRHRLRLSRRHLRDISTRTHLPLLHVIRVWPTILREWWRLHAHVHWRRLITLVRLRVLHHVAGPWTATIWTLLHVRRSVRWHRRV
jgi:hypothetical protein